MANTYDAAVAALRAHWKAHADKQPRALVLSPAQHDELTEMRRAGLAGLNVDASRMDANIFMGVAIERRDGSPGLWIGMDGAETPLDLG